ncbi:hypothetical protein SERLA73DRAFT_191624 [Serpula lacrymans var. lacrymans S7.3]|uniref:Hydrophobin n=2 Tax=Serpula lacrymans var. lacrymans TaxID=341189 RepID=F8QHY6_SERL3|nr:uncharacterized protein SERLADRAFT_476999 [Serpula lacrymans var. lacrymans S7.9]EGN92095.1 hypothetical protein SERLA73DRAFT_191624 [Serpula lacrymans var. lacrymans S7.3]EGO20613.1 hypothetical protein SERLADRAFT_476999 [Serpula lacrymans var. lacrymans S7.9]
MSVSLPGNFMGCGCSSNATLTTCCISVGSTPVYLNSTNDYGCPFTTAGGSFSPGNASVASFGSCCVGGKGISGCGYATNNTTTNTTTSASPVKTNGSKGGAKSAKSRMFWQSFGVLAILQAIVMVL